MYNVTKLLINLFKLCRSGVMCSGQLWQLWLKTTSPISTESYQARPWSAHPAVYMF